ncbi:hypothetical protein BGLA2_2300020 [Burkholderia gladioli]|nr:hypothetical protein BGLA2_2300020 [Burkholderia gladioli]
MPDKVRAAHLPHGQRTVLRYHNAQRWISLQTLRECWITPCLAGRSQLLPFARSSS